MALQTHHHRQRLGPVRSRNSQRPGWPPGSAREINAAEIKSGRIAGSAQYLRHYFARRATAAVVAASLCEAFLVAAATVSRHAKGGYGDGLWRTRVWRGKSELFSGWQTSAASHGRSRKPVPRRERG